jgi:hypothetical protein
MYIIDLMSALVIIYLLPVANFSAVNSIAQSWYAGLFVIPPILGLNSRNCGTVHQIDQQEDPQAGTRWPVELLP